MFESINPLGRPVGVSLPGWKPPDVPPRHSLQGNCCRLEPVEPQRHAAELYRACTPEGDGAGWTYLPYGPFASLSDYQCWMTDFCLGDDPLFFAIIAGPDERPQGLASYLRITPEAGTIEIGHLHFSPGLKQSAAATEAMFLMLRLAFHLGYRRCEWKCDALNAASRAAARRLGFSYEGLFRQATVTKGRNRDTAWYAIIDRDWPALNHAIRRWLEPSNFDEHGRQRLRLSELTRPLLTIPAGDDVIASRNSS